MVQIPALALSRQADNLCHDRYAPFGVCFDDGGAGTADGCPAVTS